MTREIPAPQHVRAIERALAEKAGAPVALTLWARAEMIVTSDGYNTAGRLLTERAERRLSAEKKKSALATATPEEDSL
jgi:hypothetical protein